MDLKPNLILLPVRNNREKLHAVFNAARTEVLKKKRVLVLVPNSESAHFLDKFFWSVSEESFFPHAIANHPTEELVTITLKEENYNQATVLLNLTPQVPIFSRQFLTIYDLDDRTTAAKQQLSLERKHAYSLFC
ncbi:MAG: DNA polymerase III subunit chi [Parachlamydiaceae bacterium]